MENKNKSKNENIIIVIIALFSLTALLAFIAYVITILKFGPIIGAAICFAVCLFTYNLATAIVEEIKE